MKNKISFSIFSIALCSAWSLASAMEANGEAARHDRNHGAAAAVQQMDLREATEEPVANILNEEIIEPQDDNEIAPEPPTEETLIAQFQTIVDALNLNTTEPCDLHQCLKQLQQAEFKNYQTSSFTWNSELQRFVHYPIDPDTVLTNLDDAVLKSLNDYVIYDRKKRRADIPAWHEQDPSEPSLLATLLSPGINLNQAQFQIAHHNGEETFGPQPPHQENIGLPGGHTILLYGFNVPGKSGPRLQVKDKLQTLFAPLTIQAMNDYNNAIDLSASGINFSDYLEFVSDAKKRNLQNSILDDNELNKLPISRPQAEAWVNFLEAHLQAFDFSRKLTSPEAIARFVAKNYKLITKNKGISDTLKQEFNKNNWSTIIEHLEPIFDCLRNVGTNLINLETQDTATIDQVAGALANQSQFLDLPSPERRKDLKFVLASIVSGAFFRTTSKLGFKFAQQQNIKVAFVWTHAFPSPVPPPLAPSAFSSLQEFRDYVEKKPYYKTDFRKNSIGGKYPEAITCSEARQLGRLKARNEAPSFLLIRDIIEPPTL